MASPIRISHEGASWSAHVEGSRVTLEDGVSFLVREADAGKFLIEGPHGPVEAISAVAEASIWIGVGSHALEFIIERRESGRGAAGGDHDALSAPMPATVVRIQVKAGDRVGAGDTLLVLEAMKMELPIRAPRAATVRAIRCDEGQLVQPDVLLVELQE